MIPNQSLSSTPLFGNWLSPDDLDTQYLLDYELGGIGLNDSSQGLRVQVWTLKLVGDDVRISAPAWPESTLFTVSGITELSLGFDQNMRPFVAYVEGGDAKFWWYDTALPGETVSSLPANSRTPRCCLDDKRETQAGTSDIILCYITSDDRLCFRAQRDRYTIEYTLKTDVPDRIVKVGMTDQNRLQWLMQGPLPEDFIC